jgi:hypothetical protein
VVVGIAILVGALAGSRDPLRPLAVFTAGTPHSAPMAWTRRLLRYVNGPYRRSVPVSRRAVFGRDGNRCQYCGGPAESIDHVLPRSKGGDHSWENVVACCRSCNVRKADRTPLEAGLQLAERPAPPRHFGWIYASTGYQLDPTWQPYLLQESA